MRGKDRARKKYIKKLRDRKIKCLCVCDRERESKRTCVCVTERGSKGKCVNVCLTKRERE